MLRGHHPGRWGNVRMPIILVRRQCLLPGTEIHHHNLHPGRDHVIRIRSTASSCTVVNLRFQPEGSVAEQRKRLSASRNVRPTHPDGVGFPVGDFGVVELDDGRLSTRTQTFPHGDTSQAAALHAAFRTLSRYPEVILPGKMNLVKAPHRNCPASTASW